MSNITCTELIYSDYLQLQYQKLSRLPGFVLLESTDTSLGRYDILSAYPYSKVIINEDSAHKELLLQSVKEQLVIEPSSSSLPFQGGAIGFISYDLGAYLQGIGSPLQPVLSDIPLLNLGFYDWALIADHLLKKLFLVAANRHHTTAEVLLEIKRLLEQKISPKSGFRIDSDFTPKITIEDYQNSINQIQEALREGRSYQVNFTQPFQASFSGDAWEMYRKVTSKNPVPFSAFLRDSKYDILSFSPERFLLQNLGILYTSPIKGTINRSKDDRKDHELKNQLVSSQKNRAENVMIVDLLRNDLGRIAQPGTVKVTNLCKVQSFSAVHHLVSDIEATCLAAIHPFDAFLSCFPGGSITGAPKKESMRIIKEQERYGRGVYCGSIGYFSHHGRFDTNIAIRTVIAKDSTLHLAAGGGIVIDSHCEDEYRECYTKIAAIINGLK